MSESIDSRAELSLRWCCLSVRSAVVIISPPTLVQIGEFGFYRQRVVLCSSNREICVQRSSNIFQMVEFNKAAQSLTDALIPQAQKRIVLNRLAKDNIALIVVLEAKFGNQPTDPSGKHIYMKNKSYIGRYSLISTFWDGTLRKVMLRNLIYISIKLSGQPR
ncbi:unnamed protein product [Arabidopsis halleri]